MTFRGSKQIFFISRKPGPSKMFSVLIWRGADERATFIFFHLWTSCGRAGKLWWFQGALRERGPKKNMENNWSRLGVQYDALSVLTVWAHRYIAGYGRSVVIVWTEITAHMLDSISQNAPRHVSEPGLHVWFMYSSVCSCFIHLVSTFVANWQEVNPWDHGRLPP